MSVARLSSTTHLWSCGSKLRPVSSSQFLALFSWYLINTDSIWIFINFCAFHFSKTLEFCYSLWTLYNDSINFISHIHICIYMRTHIFVYAYIFTVWCVIYYLRVNITNNIGIKEYYGWRDELALTIEDSPCKRLKFGYKVSDAFSRTLRAPEHYSYTVPHRQTYINITKVKNKSYTKREIMPSTRNLDNYLERMKSLILFY